MLSPGLVVLLGIVFCHQTSASCWGKDAHFDKTKPPVLTPDRKEPTKVQVDWGKQIERPQCVDRFYVRVWPDGTEMDGGRKILVDQKLTSLEVTVEPCISYRFRVDLEEDDTTGKDVEMTAEQLVRTTAKPVVVKSLAALDEHSRPRATYWWDPLRQVVDLTKVSITFPSHTITYPSCLDYIQVTGSEVRTKSGPPLSHQPSKTRGRSLSFSHTTETTSYNPSISVGPASTLPARISYSDVAKGAPASPSSLSSSGSPIPLLTPNFAYALPRPTGGALTKLGPIKVTPPFLAGGLPEILVPVSGCNQFTFDIQLVAGGKTVDTLHGVILPSLADIPGYVPAPVTSVMTISYSPKGQAIYAVKKDSGVTAACLPAYFEAYDAYIQRLENEVGWQIGRGKRVDNLMLSTREELEDSEEELLKATGCACTSPHLQLSSTDPKVLKHTEKNQLGHYHFAGVYSGYPYFTKKALQPSEKPMFLYYSLIKTTWLVGPEVGATKNVFFGSDVNPSAKCPGDAGMRWQAAVGTFGRWKSSPLTEVKCEKNI